MFVNTDLKRWKCYFVCGIENMDRGIFKEGAFKPMSDKLTLEFEVVDTRAG